MTDEIYTGACNMLSMQRSMAIKHCRQKIEAITARGAVMELDADDQQQLIDLVTRIEGPKALLAAGCPA